MWDINWIFAAVKRSESNVAEKEISWKKFKNQESFSALWPLQPCDAWSPAVHKNEMNNIWDLNEILNISTENTESPILKTNNAIIHRQLF